MQLTGEEAEIYINDILLLPLNGAKGKRGDDKKGREASIIVTHTYTLALMLGSEKQQPLYTLPDKLSTALMMQQLIRTVNVQQQQR